PVDFIVHLLISLGIGALIGAEREQHRDHEQLVIAGIRTYPLISSAGFLVAYLSSILKIEYLVLVGVAIFGAMAVMYFFIRHSLKLTGMTSPVAVLVTFLLGILVGYERILEALVVGVATTFVLLAKERLHAFVMALTYTELVSALQFIVIAFILYPLTINPIIIRDINIGAYHIEYFNLYDYFNLNWILLIVIFVSSLSFASFIAMRYYGTRKGMGFTGMLGGLVNSEAVTGTISGLVAKNEGIMNLGLTSIILANVTMLIRNFAIGAFSDPTLKVANIMLIPILFMCIASMVIKPRIKVEKEQQEKIELESPFAIIPAIKFAIIFGVISLFALLLVFYLEAYGEYGIILTALGGFVSSAAVTASIATLAFTGHINPLIGGITIITACIISTINKLLLASTSSKSLAKKLLYPQLMVSIAGIIGLIIIIVIYA
ncbi:MAG: DUF4010 domain-containing protein, partial [Candidatus Thermoplasmatota archaeon]